MKLSSTISRSQGQAGITLIECMVYIAVFLILSGIALGTFCLSWDRSRALALAANNINAALSAGERWRADVRNATGTIIVQTTAAGETMKIPEGKEEVVYSFDSGQVRRQIGPATPAPDLPDVVSSEMNSEMRGNVRAWRWELELAQRRKETHLPLLFTFEAAQRAP